MGIPNNEIAFIHSANNDAKKKELFAEVNDGNVRVLIGPTSKMGTGTNVQKHSKVIHHLDCLWRPFDFTQREGRYICHGNDNKEDM